MADTQRLMDAIRKLIATAEVVNKYNVALAQTSASLHADNLYRDYMFKMPGARELDEAFQEYYACFQPDTSLTKGDRA